MKDDRKLLLSALTVVGVAFIWPMLATRMRHSKVTAGAVFATTGETSPYHSLTGSALAESSESLLSIRRLVQ
jgi:hypothetical protein